MPAATSRSSISGGCWGAVVQTIFVRLTRASGPVLAVKDLSWRATSSGVPEAMTRPPSWPPSGPRSMTQSAVLMTSMLCSMITTVLP